MTDETQNVVTRTSTESISADNIQKLEESCNNCKPLTMSYCVANCHIWKLKNELRDFYRSMLQNTDFMEHLLNTIKNERRQQILQLLAKGHYTIEQLQQLLKNSGYDHSQQTIIDEYLTPLMQVELVNESAAKYHNTAFGNRLQYLVQNLGNVENLLPAHSECHEEIVLALLLNGARTYAELEAELPLNNMGRVISRLEASQLIETSAENDHIFFFRSKRDLSKETLSPTEHRVYETITENGISARRLANYAKISLRRTYKYLRRLKGKKLIFVRDRPKTYYLTPKGKETASALNGIRNLVMEQLAIAARMVKDEETYQLIAPEVFPQKNTKKNGGQPTALLTIIQKPKTLAQHTFQ